MNNKSVERASSGVSCGVIGASALWSLELPKIIFNLYKYVICRGSKKSNEILIFPKMAMNLAAPYTSS